MSDVVILLLVAGSVVNLVFSAPSLNLRENGYDESSSNSDSNPEFGLENSLSALPTNLQESTFAPMPATINPTIDNENSCTWESSIDGTIVRRQEKCAPRDDHRSASGEQDDSCSEESHRKVHVTCPNLPTLYIRMLKNCLPGTCHHFSLEPKHKTTSLNAALGMAVAIQNRYGWESVSNVAQWCCASFIDKVGFLCHFNCPKKTQ